MRLDRNMNADGRGKYALLKLRQLEEFRGADGSFSMDITDAISLLVKYGILDWGDKPETEFFVIHLKDKYAHDMSALDEIDAERKRQIEVEGWTAVHDDQHADGEMAIAAGIYAIHTANPSFFEYDWGFGPEELYPLGWPWHRQWWKPKNPRRDLVRAAALIVAEIERLDRLATPTA